MIIQENNKQWHIESLITPEAEDSLHGYPPILRQILFNRGIADHEKARIFLEGQKPPGTSPGNLLGIDVAVERIQKAIEQGEKIAIYGDYDVDGVTATALLSSALGSFNANITSYIPNRFDEGYGLNNDALDSLKKMGVDLVITVDCGIRSLNEASYAKSLGLDLIISDHHHPANDIPQAVAIIDPKQPGDDYPTKELAGVGIAYKLLEALSDLYDSKFFNLSDYLDLVALGTVADLVPLIDENRYLVKEGLNILRRPHRQGIMSLIGVAGLNPEKINATDIGFTLGPRLNAAGRLETALDALDLLLTNDVNRASLLAQKLDNQNRLRQMKTREIQEKAEVLAFSQDPDPLLLFAIDENFNSGVVGLVASRLTERFYRPAIVGQSNTEFTKASCRSIKEFHITKALDQCADLLEHHGGHAAAAGFTIRNSNLLELEDRLRIIANEQLSALDLQPTIKLDVDNIILQQLTPSLLKYLEWFQPTGYGNPIPTFASRGLQVINARVVGKDGSHLKLTISDGWLTFDAIAFRQGYWQDRLPSIIDIAYHFEMNEYKGRQSLQLNIKDIKPAE